MRSLVGGKPPSKGIGRAQPRFKVEDSTLCSPGRRNRLRSALDPGAAGRGRGRRSSATGYRLSRRPATVGPAGSICTPVGSTPRARTAGPWRRRRSWPGLRRWRGRNFIIADDGDRTSISASRVEMSSGVGATSTSVPWSRQVRSNQLSSTVLPLPRGPVRTTSCGGEVPQSRSARHRVSTACSRSRPVSAGGMAPAPGVNTRCCVPVMPTKITTPRRHASDEKPNSWSSFVTPRQAIAPSGCRSQWITGQGRSSSVPRRESRREGRSLPAGGGRGRMRPR